LISTNIQEEDEEEQLDEATNISTDQTKVAADEDEEEEKVGIETEEEAKPFNDVI
jgi:hypothetical protein